MELIKSTLHENFAFAKTVQLIVAQKRKISLGDGKQV